MCDLNDDPLLRAGIRIHGLSLRDAPWHRSGLSLERQLDLCDNGAKPSIHVDDRFVFMNWNLADGRVHYSIEKRNEGLHRTFQIEGGMWPLSLITSCGGRTLGELVGIQGAWKMDILSGWEDGNNSSSYDIAPATAGFLGSDDRTLLSGLTRMGVSRREIGDRPEYKMNTSRGECFIGRDRSCVVFRSRQGGDLCYEIQRKKDEETVRIYMDGVLPESVIARMIGMQTRDVLDLPHLGGSFIEAIETSRFTTMTIFSIGIPA